MENTTEETTAIAVVEPEVKSAEVQIVPQHRGLPALGSLDKGDSFKASELRAFYREAGYSGKGLTEKVNEVLDKQATPAGQARFNLRVTQGYRLRRLAIHKSTGVETFALEPQKATKQSATAKVKELEAEIAKIRAELAAKLG